MKKVKPQALEKMLSVKFISLCWKVAKLGIVDASGDQMILLIFSTHGQTAAMSTDVVRLISFSSFSWKLLNFVQWMPIEKRCYILIFSSCDQKKKVKMLGFFLSDVYLLSFDWLIDWLIILYSYELVMRAIVSLWFPETWTMTRRETESHSSRWWKP